MRRIKYPLLVKKTEEISCGRCGNVVRTEEVQAGGLIARFLEPPQSQGANIAEMEYRISIVRKVRKASQHVDLEEAEWKKIMEGVDGVKWLQNNEDILACGIAIREAEETEVEVVEPSGDGPTPKAEPRAAETPK